MSITVKLGFATLTDPASELLNFNALIVTVDVPTAWSAPLQDHAPPYPEPEPDFAAWASAKIVLT